MGEERGGRVRVLTGLQPGDRVVTQRRAAGRPRSRAAALDAQPADRGLRAPPRGGDRSPSLIVAAFGVRAYLNTPIEAYPDVTNAQVTVISQMPGYAPEEIERSDHRAARARAERHAAHDRS